MTNSTIIIMAIAILLGSIIIIAIAIASLAVKAIFGISDDITKELKPITERVEKIPEGKRLRKNGKCTARTRHAINQGLREMAKEDGVNYHDPEVKILRELAKAYYEDV